MARRQQLGAGRLVRLRGEGDPGEAAAEGIDAACFQMERQPRRPLGAGGGGLDPIAEGAEIVVQRLPAGDHREGGARFGRLPRLFGQLRQEAGRMGGGGPGVFGVAPGAAHGAARQPDEEGAAAGVQAFPLQGVEGFHHRQGRRGNGWRGGDHGQGRGGRSDRPNPACCSAALASERGSGSLAQPAAPAKGSSGPQQGQGARHRRWA